MTRSESYKDGSSSFEKTHVLTFQSGGLERKYRTYSRVQPQQPPEAIYEVTSRGINYLDFRKHMLNAGFSIESETVLIKNRPLQAVLLSWDLSAIESSEQTLWQQFKLEQALKALEDELEEMQK